MRARSFFPSRRSDPVMEELVSVLAKGGTHEFRPLFDLVLANLRARDAVTSSEDLLRLRAYENLQKLLAKGAVRKTGKSYTAHAERIAVIESTLSQRGALRKPQAVGKTKP
jgi:hypothetical protein